MPELPEVETTVRGLKKEIVGWKITNLWTDWPKFFKKPSSENTFKKCILGERIEGVNRKGKNILINLSGEKILLIHQKMSGHLLLGKWQKREEIKGKIDEGWEKEKWVPQPFEGYLANSKNKYIHLVFFLEKGKEKRMLALSDLRKFAKVLCGDKKEIIKPIESKIGMDPTKPEFTFNNFREALRGKRGRIKSVLMDQKVISGIGNIYSDEILWKAGIHPLTPVNKISERDMEKLHEAIREILKRAIKLKGTSIGDYRTTKGEKGKYGEELLVYQKEGEPCPKCGTRIESIRVGGRSARFCPKCQIRHKTLENKVRGK